MQTTKSSNAELFLWNSLKIEIWNSLKWWLPSLTHSYFNSLRPRQNRRHLADDIFKCIFFYENVWISIKLSLKYVPKGPIDNIPALVQIMAWRRPGDKPLSDPMMLSLLTHICVTRPQCVNNHMKLISWINLGMRSTNDRRRYNVTWTLMSWARAQNDPCTSCMNLNSLPSVGRL